MDISDLVSLNTYLTRYERCLDKKERMAIYDALVADRILRIAIKIQKKIMQ